MADDEEPTDLSEVTTWVAADGLIAAAARLHGRERNDEAVIAALAAAATERGEAFGAEDQKALEALSRGAFFDVQIVLTSVIPRLQLPADQVMALVHALVEKGGNDGAAYRPHASCSKPAW